MPTPPLNPHMTVVTIKFISSIQPLANSALRYSISTPIILEQTNNCHNIQGKSESNKTTVRNHYMSYIIDRSLRYYKHAFRHR